MPADACTTTQRQSNTPRHTQAIKDLDTLAATRTALDWNGTGSMPISSRTIAQSRRILFRLPDDLPTPMVFPGERGEVCLAWSPGHGAHVTVRILSVTTISEQHLCRLVYIWGRGTLGGVGASVSEGDIPPSLASLIRSTVGPVTARASAPAPYSTKG